MQAMRSKIENLAVNQAEAQGLLEDERLREPEDRFYGKPREYAMARCAFYECSTCKEAFFGGLVDCEREQ